VGNITAPLGGDFPVAYPGPALLPLLLELPSAGGEPGAPAGHCRASAAAVLELSQPVIPAVKNPAITLVSALCHPHQPGCTPRAPTEFAAGVQQPPELAGSSAGSAARQGQQLWLRGQVTHRT